MEGTSAFLQRDVLQDLSRRVLGCAIDVHRELGPGLLESVYRSCLARDLQSAGLTVRQEVAMPVIYKGELIDCGFRADLLIEEAMLVELKAVDRLLPIHEAQILTYLRLSRLRLGLLVNFNVRVLKDGVRRLVS